MDRRETAKAYLDGQLSRRVFLRRMIALGLTLPAAIAYADLLKADPARAGVYDYYVYVTDFYYDPGRKKVSGIGTTVEFGFDPGSSYSHSATDPTRVINSGFKSPGSTHAATMHHSGTFDYRCREGSHASMTGRIRVPMWASPTSAPPGTSIEMGWSQISGGDFHFDVQRRRPSDSAWQDWITDTDDRGTTITLSKTGTHLFRSRARNTVNGKVSGWSPILELTIT
jgi:plastocyanin